MAWPIPSRMTLPPPNLHSSPLGPVRSRSTVFIHCHHKDVSSVCQRLCWGHTLASTPHTYNTNDTQRPSLHQNTHPGCTSQCPRGAPRRPNPPRRCWRSAPARRRAGRYGCCSVHWRVVVSFNLYGGVVVWCRAIGWVLVSLVWMDGNTHNTHTYI